jgi:hypothetical protein
MRGPYNVTVCLDEIRTLFVNRPVVTTSPVEEPMGALEKSRLLREEDEDSACEGYCSPARPLEDDSDEDFGLSNACLPPPPSPPYRVDVSAACAAYVVGLYTDTSLPSTDSSSFEEEGEEEEANAARVFKASVAAAASAGAVL